MEIKKNLKDHKLTATQRIFAAFFNEQLGSLTCSEKITNKNYMRQYFSPDNDFLIYSTAIEDASRLTKIQPPIYDKDNEIEDVG